MRSAILLLVLVSSSLLASEAPDLSGTWKLDEKRSERSAGASLNGLGGNAGTPQALYITHAKNGIVIVGSDMNTSHARTYEPGTGRAAPISPGSETVMASRWEGRVLVAEGRDASVSTELREAFVLSDDASELTVEVRATSPDGVTTTTLLYKRVESERPCTEWPTPCKDFTASGVEPSQP